MIIHPNAVQIENERLLVFGYAVDIMDGLAGDYFQCLETPETIPDGTKALNFDETQQVVDEIRGWTDLNLPGNLKARCQYAVHRYNGPEGVGYILYCRVLYLGDLWVYAEHHGPELRSDTFDEWYIQEAD